MNLKERAKELLFEFKRDRYAFGWGVLDRVGPMTAELGRRAVVVGRMGSPWFRPALDRALASLRASGVEVVRLVQGASPNAPREDVYRIQGHLLHTTPDVVVSIDSGSGIDACKAAAVLATFGDVEAELDPYFGVGEVTRLSRATGRPVLPVVAAMTAASSAAHLTKYSNVTDPVAAQKKLIVDEAIVPPRAVFDYALTLTQPTALTLDGGLDGLSHCLEVYLGDKGPDPSRVEEVCLCGIEVILTGLTILTRSPSSRDGRELLALGTDLGGYAIMLGGTSGAHLTSFSLVSYLSHGRACALMNPYSLLFFAPAVEERARRVGRIYQKLGYLGPDPDHLTGRDLGLAVAEAMTAFSRTIGFPTRLSEVEGMDRRIIDQVLRAARDPTLESKLRNMPVPLSADLIEPCMRPVLEAAWDGDFRLIGRAAP